MNRSAIALLCGIASLGTLGSALPIVRSRPQPRRDRVTVAAADTVTFSRHIAPILFAHCAVCHRAGEAAPFSLLTYREAHPWAGRIAEVTRARSMPPWLPAPGYGAFEGERRLTEEQINLIGRWVEQGALEGDPGDLPNPPRWTQGWQLGEPDLVLRMPERYSVPDSGTDIFRNFVIPVPLESARWVEAVELRPGNPKVVHHAVLMVDRTPSSRLLSERDPDPGFEGMHSASNAQLPEGFLVGWAPGKMPSREAEGTAWSLDGETDLVLQLHLRPSGDPETIEAAVGLHFADDPPARRPVLVKLVNELLDIPAGERNYVVRDKFPLPVAVEVLSLFPHAHYLR